MHRLYLLNSANISSLERTCCVPSPEKKGSETNVADQHYKRFALNQQVFSLCHCHVVNP